MIFEWHCRGLDYIAAAGAESFYNMMAVCKNQLMTRAQSTEDLACIKTLDTGLKEALRSLKSDYKNEIRPTSTVASHCLQWSLSDPSDRQLISTCDHDHKDFCVRKV